MKKNAISKNNIFKFILAALAVAFIIFAALTADKREKDEAAEKAAEEERLNDLPNIENEEFAAVLPPMPDSASMNSLTREECELAVKEERMLCFTSSNGITVYVNNYRNDELLKAALDAADEENDAESKFKSFLYSDYCAFDINEDAVRARYDEELKRYQADALSVYGMSMPRYLEANNYPSDQYRTDLINLSLRFVRDMAMAETVLNDTVGDVNEADIETFAKENGYDSTAVFIEEHGRNSILYRLRPQKLLEYIDTRLKELGY